MTASRWHSVERLSILAEWEAFAATLLSAAVGMTSLALRDPAAGDARNDMRSPLNSILTTASYLGALNAGEEV